MLSEYPNLSPVIVRLIQPIKDIGYTIGGLAVIGNINTSAKLKPPSTVLF